MIADLIRENASNVSISMKPHLHSEVELLVQPSLSLMVYLSSPL